MFKSSMWVTLNMINVFQAKKKKEKHQMKPILPPTETAYGTLNVTVSGYDMRLVENYSKYIHNFCNRLGIKVAERSASLRPWVESHHWVSLLHHKITLCSRGAQRGCGFAPTNQVQTQFDQSAFRSWVDEMTRTWCVSARLGRKPAATRAPEFGPLTFQLNPWQQKISISEVLLLFIYLFISYALPTKTTEVMLMQEQGTKLYVEAVLKTHGRVVQVRPLESSPERGVWFCQHRCSFPVSAAEQARRGGVSGFHGCGFDESARRSQARG